MTPDQTTGVRAGLTNPQVKMNRKQYVEVLKNLGYTTQPRHTRTIVATKEGVRVTISPASSYARWGSDDRPSVCGKNAAMASKSSKELASVLKRPVHWFQSELSAVSGYAQPDGRLTQLSNDPVKISWEGGRNHQGYITDFKPARKNAKHPLVGTALYVATKPDGSISFQERRAYHIDNARQNGLI